jgi:IclR family KDG regulon transcriptional repressor
MEARGYLARNSAGHYQMTRKLFDLQQNEPEEKVLTRVALPVMERLVESCRETVNLGILDAAETVVISTIESRQAIRMTSKVGNRRYLHSTALGKVLLSGLSQKEVERLIRIQGLPKLMPRTITTREALSAELDLVRKQGFSVDNEENEPGGRCVGAPIFGQDGRVIAALSISAPIFRLDMGRIRSLSAELIQACRAISRALTSVAEPAAVKQAAGHKSRRTATKTA